MNRLSHLVLLGILGLVVVAASSRALIALAGALIPLVLVLGIVLAVLRVVWFRNW